MTDKAMSHKKAHILAAVAAIAAVACAAPGPPAVTASPTVQLWPQAVVQGEKVLLADLAGIEGLDGPAAQAMRQIEVAGASSRSARPWPPPA
jgi:hypothetical protein